MSPMHQYYVQPSWHTLNKRPKEICFSYQNKGTATKSVSNRSFSTPFNLARKQKLHLQQAEVMHQSLECSTNQSFNLMETGIILRKHAYHLQLPLDYKIGIRIENSSFWSHLLWLFNEPDCLSICFHWRCESDWEYPNMVIGGTYKTMIEKWTPSVGRGKNYREAWTQYEVRMVWSEPEANLTNDYSSVSGHL